MRILILTRGAPGSGKTTWIRENGLEPYTLSADRLRLMYSAPELLPEGKLDVSQKVNKQVFRTLMDMLEIRMANGDLTVVDACHSRTADFEKYKLPVKNHRYRTILVDFSDIGLEECRRRNQMRDPMSVIPESSLERMHSQLVQSSVPSWIQIFSHKDPIVL